MSHLIAEHIRGFEIKFETKPGVFSKEGLDLGSKLLIKNVQISDQTMIADLGCGTGVIGMVAAKLNPNGHVHLLDVNLRVIDLAKKNVELNKLKNTEVYLSDLFSAVNSRTYHVILSNPPLHLGNEFLDEAAKECYGHLKTGGTVWRVVQKHLKPVIKRLFSRYFNNHFVIAYGRQHIVIKAEKLN